jgi:hypothetical protein
MTTAHLQSAADRPAVGRRGEFPASCEGCFDIEFWAPVLDRLVGDVVSSAFNRLDGKTVIKWKILAALPSVACSIQRNDFGRRWP